MTTAALGERFGATHRSSGLAIVLLTVLATDPLAAQVGWTQAASAGPSALQAPAMAYDTVAGRSVLFGDDGTFSVGGTWEWDGVSWSGTSAAGPTARSLHAMTYDSQRGRLVLFSGVGSIGFLGDTWERSGGVWSPQLFAAGPAARRGHSMAYDSQRGRTILFGGDGSTGFIPGTWEWNGIAWAQVASGGPPDRSWHSMVFDTQRARTVLFGGSGPNLLGDTWEWDGNTWVQVAVAGPVARQSHAMAYDVRRGRTVLFGGDAASARLGDTWGWDGNTWVQLSTAGPSARVSHAMAYDSRRHCVVMFGGLGAAGYLDDTWEWGDLLFPSSATTFGVGCGQPVLDLAPTINAPPIINTTARASLSNITSPLAFVALGWSRTMFGPFALPLTLVGYGMPGCYLLQSSEAAAQPVSFTGASTATYSLPLPNLSALIGMRVYLQGWAVAPSANASGTIVSNGVEWVIGSS